MGRFVTPRDFEFIQKVNRELMTEILDTVVILYKPHTEASRVNIYGESTQKVRYIGVTLQTKVRYPKNAPEQEGVGYDTTQRVDFHFVRRLLEEVDVRPEVGDLIFYNDLYYEIDNVVDTQLMANKPEFSMSILCYTHLTRKSGLNIEPRLP